MKHLTLSEWTNENRKLIESHLVNIPECSYCEGTGEHECNCGDSHECNRCDGTGKEGGKTEKSFDYMAAELYQTYLDKDKAKLVKWQKAVAA